MPFGRKKKTANTQEFERTRWKFQTYSDSYGDSSVRPVRDDEEGDLLGSLTTNGTHAPCIDLDFDCDLVPSSTPGHYHLMINQEMPWDQYRKLLDAFFETGLIDRGWYTQSIRDQCSMVRQPGVWKQFEDIRKQIEQTGDLFP